jgi:hypothetical protein
MLNKLKMLVLSFSGLVMLGLPAVLTPAMASAATPPGCDKSTGIDNPACPTGDEDKKVNDLIRNIVNVMTAIIGAVAVIMIIFGGFKYVTSGGSHEKVANAKNTIMYALIGLVVVVLAQVIARFVLGKASDATGG